MSLFAGETERLLWRESWRSEREINVYRATIWTLVCFGLTVADWLQDLRNNTWVVGGLLYGIACGALSFGWLRRNYHPAVPLALSSLDLLVLGVIADHTQRQLEETGRALADFNLYVMPAAFLLLLAANALRFSWRVAVWSGLVAVATYATLLSIHHVEYPSTAGFAMVHLVAMTGILAYAARKLGGVIRRVEERNALARFLPGPLVDLVTGDPTKLALGGKEYDATVLFTDIRGFTTLSEKLEPTEVIELLNEYFDEMVAEIFACDGILDKFLGDGIIAVFGAPHEESDQAERAIRCARGMLRRLERLNARRAQRGAPPIHIGIGIHSGALVAGKVGNPQRMEYTHIGDTVNTASRIEGLTKELDAPLLVSREALDRAGDIDCESAPMGTHELRGRPRPVELFAIS